MVAMQREFLAITVAIGLFVLTKEGLDSVLIHTTKWLVDYKRVKPGSQYDARPRVG